MLQASLAVRMLSTLWFVHPAPNRKRQTSQSPERSSRKKSVRSVQKLPRNLKLMLKKEESEAPLGFFRNLCLIRKPSTKLHNLSKKKIRRESVSNILKRRFSRQSKRRLPKELLLGKPLWEHPKASL